MKNILVLILDLRVTKAIYERKLRATETWILIWMCTVTKTEKIENANVGGSMKIELLSEQLKGSKLTTYKEGWRLYN